MVPSTCRIFSLFGFTRNPLASSAGMEATELDRTALRFTFSVLPILVRTCSDWVDLSL